MRRLTFAIASATLAVATLAGCGGDDKDTNEAYCDSVRSAAKSINGVTGQGDIKAAVDNLKKVRDEASGKTKENWDILITSYEAVQKGDVADVDSAKLEKAGKDLEKQVKADCDIDLNESTS